MTISLSCDTCGRNYQLKDAAAGKKIRCKDCETIMTVPDADVPFEDYGDDPWGNNDSSGSKQDDFWNSSDDEWGDSSGAYSAPSPYSVKSGGPSVASSPSRPKKPRKKQSSSSGSGSNAGAMIGKIVGGLFVGLVVLGLIVRVGGAIGKMGFGGSLDWQDFKPPGTPFAIQMPGKPKQSSQFQAGISITQFMVESRRPERAFGLMHATMPIPAGVAGTLDAADVDEVFKESKQGMILAAPGARVHSESKINIKDSGGNSHPGVELTVTIPHEGAQLKFTYRLFLIGTRMVITLAGAEERNYASNKTDFDKFLNSLKITQAVTPITGNGAAPMNDPGVLTGNDFNDPTAFNPPPNDFPPNDSPPPGGINPNPGGQFPNPAAELNRRMQEDRERRLEESRQRMEQIRKESEERRKEIQNRFRRPPGFP